MIVACRSCAHSFEALAYRDSRCPACGQVTPTARACAACARPVAAQRIAELRLDLCQGCGGSFLDSDAINELLAGRDDSRVDDVIAALAASAPSAAPVATTERTCPACAVPMRRTLSPEGAGVIIDVCKAHGVFLDANELRRMIEFIRREARERQELAWQRAPAINRGSRDENSEITVEGVLATAGLILLRILLG